jgi:hypothetical protein
MLGARIQRRNLKTTVLMAMRRAVAATGVDFTAIRIFF